MSSNKSNTFLQRIASSDTLLRPQPRKQASAPPELHKSVSSSTLGSSASFSIPIPSQSWGMKTLSQLQTNDYGDYDDIINLLIHPEKAILLLPVSRPRHPSAHIDMDFIKSHILFYTNPSDKSFVMTLNGIRGVFQSDQFIALDALPNEFDAKTLLEASDKKTFFDNFDLDPASITTNQPRCNVLASHVPVKLKNDQTIFVMLIQKPLSKSDVVDWIQKKTVSRPTASKSKLPLEDPLTDHVNKFIKSVRQRPPKTMDLASVQWADFLDELQGMMGDKRDDTITDRLDNIEDYMCTYLYDKLFGSPEDTRQDEVLESRIAALNLLDLNLGHLGVAVGDADIPAIDDMVRSAGEQFMGLNTFTTAKDKLDSLVRTHQIIVDAIESFAVNEKDVTHDGQVDVAQEMQQAMTTATAQEEEAASHHHKDHSAIKDTKDMARLGTASADVLLPLLIYTIVKTNPTNFISNLRFTHRFRHPAQLTGLASYCITNISAAVTFLESTNLVGLGLSVDKVHSNVTDLNALPIPHGSASTTPTSSGGMRLVSEVMDSSYKMFDGLGRFWQRSTADSPSSATAPITPALSSSTSTVDREKAKSPRLFSPGELKEMTTSAVKSFGRKDGSRDVHHQSSQSVWENAIPGFLEQRRPTVKPAVTSSTTTAKIDPLQALLHAPSQLINSIQRSTSPSNEAAMQKFLDVKSVNDLTIGEVAELLADYKRLAAILKQGNVVQ